MIVLQPADDQLAVLWQTAIELSRQQRFGWTLIGAQMVALHALEHGKMPPRQSRDLDVLVNLRLLHDGTRHVSQTLRHMGFDFMNPDAFGIGHRFRRGLATVDVLAPEGLSPTMSRVTVPPARTVSVPGGTQALARTEYVAVSLGSLIGSIPRPNLLGAILIKARAVAVDDLPSAQLSGLAFLLSLVQNPRALGQHSKGSERRWLRDRSQLLDPDHPAWRDIDDAEAGQRVLRILSAS